MGRRHAARDGAGGGEGIQALRRTRPRLIPAAVATGAFAPAAAYVVAAADRFADAFAIAAVVAVAALGAGAALALPPVVTGGLALFLGALGLQVATSDTPLDLRAAVLAALVVVAAETAYGAAEGSGRGRSLRLVARRAAATAGAGAAAFAIAAFVLVAGGADVGEGLVVELLGVGAAVAALALVASLAAAARPR